MKQLKLTKDLKQLFKSNPETLIFEGYCSNAGDVTILNEGDSYALIAKVGESVDVCFKTRNASFVSKVIAKLHGTVKLCGVDPFVTQIFKARYFFKWQTSCDLYVWNGKRLRHRPEYAVYPMEVDFAQRVCDVTHYHPSFNEVADCILNRPSAAIYVDEVPVCWCLQHLEKSLGMLYTEPEHRNQGYALEVMVALCKEIIENGDIPFAYIVQGNVASANLAAKYNLVKVKQADYFEVNLDKTKEQEEAELRKRVVDEEEDEEDDYEEELDEEEESDYEDEDLDEEEEEFDEEDEEFEDDFDDFDDFDDYDEDEEDEE